jgi:hypothetical protein
MKSLMTVFLNIFFLLTILLGVSVTIMAFGESPDSQALIVTEWQLPVSVTVPHTGWEMSIESVYHVDHKIWVVVTLRLASGLESDSVFAQVITQRKQTILITGPKFPVSIVMIGKTWNWTHPEDAYMFVSRLSEIDGFQADLFQTQNELPFTIIKP